jgi:hypothetical protein
MARIALVLSGQLRSFAKGYEYMFENLLRHHQVDVYFHTWSKNWNHGVLQYLPAQFLVEDDKVFGDYPIFRIASPRHPARNTILMYRSIHYADMLRRTSGVEHDWVVRTRFDFALNRKIPFDELDKTKMYFCDTRSNEQKTAVHDQFCIATPQDMDHYSDVYPNIAKYHSDGCVVNGEDLLEHHLKCKGLLGNKVEYINLNPPFLHGRYNYGPHSLIRDDMENWT